MASFNKKTYVITSKNVAYFFLFFFLKYAIVFASTQLRITRLRKYPIDPKAYLGRGVNVIIFNIRLSPTFCEQYIIRAEILKMLATIANKEDPDQTASLEAV